MAFVVTLLIAMLLTFLELSFLPYFSLYSISPLLVLPFLIDLSLKSRNNILPIIAFMAGIIFDFSAGSTVPFYTILFLLAVMIDRIIFYRKSSYSNKITYISIMAVTVIIVYISKLEVLYNNQFSHWQDYLFSFFTCLVLTIIFGLLIDRVLERYFLWLEERTEK